MGRNSGAQEVTQLHRHIIQRLYVVHHKVTSPIDLKSYTLVSCRRDEKRIDRIEDSKVGSLRAK